MDLKEVNNKRILILNAIDVLIIKKYYLFSFGFTAFVSGFLALGISGTGSPIPAIRTPEVNGHSFPFCNLPVLLSFQTLSFSFSISFLFFSFSCCKAESII